MSRRVPGLIAVVLANRPADLAIPLHEDRLTVGRGTFSGSKLDLRLSRLHAEISLGEDGWSIRDLGSRNGVFVDGRRISQHSPMRDGTCVRLGDSIFLCEPDLDEVTLHVSPSGPLTGRRLRALSDLYRRIAKLVVDMPDFGLRRTEIPWLIRASLPPPIELTASLYYRALLLEWPGRMRQLRSVLRAASRSAPVGKALTADDLDAALAAESSIARA
jgi:hypothetical protein